MEIVLKGIVNGALLAFMVGPVFFTIIQTSVERGFNKGVLVAVGVSMSDIMYITITYLGLSQILDNHRIRTYLTYGGAVMLVAFGIYYLFVKTKRLAEIHTEEPKPRSPLRYVVKGFAINGLTPMMFLFWISAMSFATTGLGYHSAKEVSLYFTGVVATVFTTDILKAKLADQLRHLMTPQFIHILNILLGLVLIGFAAYLVLLDNHIL